MNQKVYEFQAVIEPVPEKGGAYVRFPYDIRKEFGKGRIKVQAEFDGVPYSGSIVNMGIKNKEETLWRCPACGRSFRHKNQEHYCGEAPRSIEEYIERQPESA